MKTTLAPGTPAKMTNLTEKRMLEILDFNGLVKSFEAILCVFQQICTLFVSIFNVAIS